MVFPIVGECLLKSAYNSKFLRYVSEEGKAQRYLQFAGDEVASPNSKFDVEQAKSDTNLVHIRCCYNNKYWVRNSQNGEWIIGAADEQEEDSSKWSCTLFKPIYVDDDAKTVRFLHVQLRNYACLMRSDDPAPACLYAGWDSPNKDLCDVFTVIDFESLVILPQYVAFKGDNGKYLQGLLPGLPMTFSGTDRGGEYVRHEIFPNPDGSVGIKQLGTILGSTSYFWLRTDNNNSISPASAEEGSSDTLFWPIKVSDNIIALRCLANNRFCVRDPSSDFIAASSSTITEQAHLQIEEVVVRRQVYEVEYRFDDAQIYDENALTMDTKTETNGTQSAYEHEFSLAYTESRSSTWTGSVSLKLGMEIEFETGVPFIFELDVKLSAEFKGSYEWGKTQETESTLESKYKVVVPAQSKLTVSLLATKGKCDVPFSYLKRDTYTDGTQSVTSMVDGVYTGVNCYRFTYDVKEEPLDS